MPAPKLYVAKNGRRTWRVRFRLDGQSCSETFDTQPEADRFCSDIRTRGVAGALRLLEAETSPQGPTLDDVAETFFTYKESRVRSDRTIADYRRDYRNWIAPTLGGRAISGIDESDVQRLVDEMGAKLSPKSVADRHAILFGILNWAAHPSRHIVDRNVAVGTDLPKRRKTAPKGLRPAEWAALYAALEQIDSDAADLALFLLATGWRFSEATALSAFDVEDDGTAVHVSMGYVVRRNAKGEHVIVEDAKSEAGLRRVKLDDDAAAMLRRRLENYDESSPQDSSRYSNGLVFTTKRGNRWHHSNFRDRAWTPAVDAANLTRKPTPHWLRHTSVAWLVMTGKVSLPEIQRRIGHESIQTTINVYGRMIDDVSSDALDAFAALRNAQPHRQIDA
jgi:integrase